jgi:hypothetical protein
MFVAGGCVAPVGSGTAVEAPRPAGGKADSRATEPIRITVDATFPSTAAEVECPFDWCEVAAFVDPVSVEGVDRDFGAVQIDTEVIVADGASTHTQMTAGVSPHYQHRMWLYGSTVAQGAFSIAFALALDQPYASDQSSVLASFDVTVIVAPPGQIAGGATGVATACFEGAGSCEAPLSCNGLICVDASSEAPETAASEATLGCASANRCDGCTSLAGCGWCGATARCEPGDETGSDACASGWAWYPAVCE